LQAYWKNVKAPKYTVILFLQVQGVVAVEIHHQLVEVNEVCIKSQKTGVDMVQCF
jgi:hypothetical protein